MDKMVLLELFGYLGSVLVVVSMLMSSVVKLRIINTVGSIISGTYALIIGSFPLALMNICLVIINIYNLKKLLMTKQEYELIKGTIDEGFVRYFLNHYEDDIKVYFPYFKKENILYDVVYVIFCDADPAGILLGKSISNQDVEIVLEYTTPKYRDCSIGKYLYSELSQKGIQKLMFTSESEKHIPYLKKMGYEKIQSSYVKKL